MEMEGWQGSQSHFSQHLPLHCSQGEFLEKLIVFRDDELRMNPESLATAQEEATLTKIRNFLNEQKVKLWEAPYYDTERKTPQEV